MPEQQRSPSEVMDEMINRRGLSYVDAISECERRAEAAAAPYLAVAEQLREAMVGDRTGP